MVAIDAAPEPAKFMRKFEIPGFVYSVGAVAALLLIWEALVATGIISSFLLPAPSQIFRSLADNFSLILSMSVATTAEFLLGFVMAVLVGLPLGALIVYSRPIRLTIYPLLVAFQSIPKPAIAPIMIVWLGTGLTSKAVIAFAIAFFPIVVDTAIGLRSAQEETVHLVRSMGGNAFDIFRYVRFPNALPAIFGGLKIASTLAVVGAIVGEFVSADKGLGYLVLVANGNLDTRLVFACVFMLTALGLAFYFAIEGLERAILRGRVKTQAFESDH
ncbi:MAG: ABC transporter permease [Methylovirgula sp.]|uniref:ABC transporter permease n=1 Tax=Methylovirgula sp. TaxID=1978224 RepID=UPI0030767FA3